MEYDAAVKSSDVKSQCAKTKQRAYSIKSMMLSDTRCTFTLLLPKKEMPKMRV